jgi:hypothetical protein
MYSYFFTTQNVSFQTSYRTNFDLITFKLKQTEKSISYE